MATSAKLHSLSHELRVLRGMCSADPQVTGFFLAVVKKDFFFHPETTLAFEYLQKKVKSFGATPDWETLVSTRHLPEDARTLLTASKVKPTRDLATAKAIVEEFAGMYRTRGMYFHCKDAIEHISAGNLEAARKAADAIQKAAHGDIIQEDEFHTMGTDETAREMIKDIVYGEESDQFIPTGLPHFDSKNGGMPRGGAVIIGGQTSVGKCLHGDTLITLLGDNTISIRDLWNNIHAQKKPDPDSPNVITGLNVPLVSFNELDNSLVQSVATAVMRSYKTLLVVELADGTRLKCSPDHRWMTASGWRRTSALSTSRASNILTVGGQHVQVLGVVNTGHVTCMYDLEVKDTHSFIANGFVSHNSHVVTQMAFYQATQGYKVVVVPLEMSEREMYNRVLAHSSGIDSLRILRKKLTSEEQDQVYKSFKTKSRKMEKAGGRLTVFRPREDLTMEQVLNACNTYAPDVIYVDYIGLLAGLDGDDQWKAMSGALRTAKVYAGNTNRIVVAAAQLSEEGQIRYSKGMKEHASLMLSLTASDKDRELKRVQVKMDKGRNQIMFNWPMHVDYSTSTMREFSPEEIEAQTAKDRVEAVRKGGEKQVKDTPNHKTDVVDEYTPPTRHKRVSSMTEDELKSPENAGDIYGFSTLDGIETNPDFKPTKANLEKHGLDEDDVAERRKKRKDKREEVPEDEPPRKKQKPLRIQEG